MRWHFLLKESLGEEGKLLHPRDGEAWKHFDRTHPTFAAETRNVRLTCSTDGFNPHNQTSRPYSCCLVIVTPYNLPPWMCMDHPYMFLTLLVPGPKSPGRSLDVYLQPLIDELKTLWNDGVETYDVSKAQNFQMRAALMWTFLPLDHPYRYQKDNFTKGKIETDSSIIRLTGEELEVTVASLPNIDFGRTKEKERIEGLGETHNWLKRSIFWDLPYWRANLIRHNLDVMHIEKNMFDNVFNTVMDVKGKTKDNVNARLDLQNICKRRHLELKEVNGKYIKPKASYTLTKEEQLMVLKWIKNLRLPDGYASNLARCVNLDDCSLHGMKSHDCNVFMERLLPLALRDLLPEPVWNALIEQRRNDNVNQAESSSRLSIFKSIGRPFSPKNPTRTLSSLEKAASTIYILLNCPKISEYVELYDAEKQAQIPNLTYKALGVMHNKEFATWFCNYTPLEDFFQETNSDPARIILDNELDDVAILTDVNRQEEEVNPVELQPSRREFEEEFESDELEVGSIDFSEEELEDEESENENNLTSDDSPSGD
ncbi:hypothetical protein BUALT_Bualt13G0034900 [Buddleja alternifolia]|uniref:Uncharacterized protein n=1 Tax=Buddleja alternifolia TaxID=168488 RepID=A0AAV6WJM0_9LAMI|nr:hypothetical protein BUALT_Bualt13G0034900 [Buddleja alternifolia]